MLGSQRPHSPLPIKAGPVVVYGPVVDEQTRCIHWASPRDIVALQFRCCRRFYPCHQCHVDSAPHPPSTWPVSEREELAVLCGACKSLLSIHEYLRLYQAKANAAGDMDACPTRSPHCPRCSAAFNPGCGKHLQLYFDLRDDERPPQPAQPSGAQGG